MNSKELSQKIDHTVLKPEATAKDFENLCQEARDNGFYAVCVPAQWVAFVKERLAGCTVKIASVVGFPHGSKGQVLDLVFREIPGKFRGHNIHFASRLTVRLSF